MTVESGLDGATLDLITPPASPTDSGFCGDPEDARALQCILFEAAKNINGQSFVVSDSESIPSPHRKKQVFEDVGEAASHDVVDEAEEYDIKVAMGLPASSSRPAPCGEDTEDEEQNVFGHDMYSL